MSSLIWISHKSSVQRNIIGSSLRFPLFARIIIISFRHTISLAINYSALFAGAIDFNADDFFFIRSRCSLLVRWWNARTVWMKMAWRRIELTKMKRRWQRTIVFLVKSHRRQQLKMICGQLDSQREQKIARLEPHRRRMHFRASDDGRFGMCGVEREHPVHCDSFFISSSRRTLPRHGAHRTCTFKSSK